MFIATSRPCRGVLRTCCLSPASCLGALVHGALSFCPSFPCVRAWSIEYDSYLLQPRSRGLSLKNFLRFSFSSALHAEIEGLRYHTQLIQTVVDDCDRFAGNLEFKDPGFCAVCHVTLVACSCDSHIFQCPSISSATPCQEGTNPSS